MSRSRIALTLLLVLHAGTIGAAERQTMEPEAALDTLRTTGRLAAASVAGDLTLTELRHPSGGTLVLLDIVVAGSLRGAPVSAIEITQSEFGAWRASRTVFGAEVTIESSGFAERLAVEETRFQKAFACRRCRFAGNLAARRARFEDEADFGFSDFSAIVDFSGARFRTASFDRARFTDPTGARFDEADFAGPASFAGADTSGYPISFRGVTFRDAASFRGCRLGSVTFGRTRPDAPESAFRNSVTSFGAAADFRRCTLGETDLQDVALRSGARFDGAILERGTLDLRGLTASGEIVLRAVRPARDVRLAVDAATASSITADAALFNPQRFAEADPDTLEALGKRAEALGARAEGRMLGFAAASARSAMPEASTAEWVTWAVQWPTRNNTDLGRPLMIGSALWLLGFLIVRPRGTLVALPPDTGKAAPGLLTTVLEPIYQPPLLDAPGLWCPATRSGRRTAAFGYALALVFKLGPRQFRPLLYGWRNGVIVGLWYAGFVLVAILAATTIALVPGLRELSAALPG